MTPQKQRLNFSDEVQFKAALFNVDIGEYTVKINTNKFAEYKQEVKIESGLQHKLVVYSSKIEPENATQVVPGWIQVGNVNGDKIIDNEDIKQILSDIRRKPQNSFSDINDDGEIDIADLQYLVQNIDAKAQASPVEKLLLPKDIIPKGNTIFKKGTAADLMNSEVVTLATSNEQPISGDNPIELEFRMAETNASPEIEGMVLNAPSIDDNGDITSDIQDGYVEVYSNDEETPAFSINLNQPATRLRKNSARSAATATQESNGSIVIDFGGQIAVKRVIIRITGTRKKEQPLVNIAKVEFVNNMEDRIPEPKLDIPTLSTPKPGNKQLDVSWNAQNNVTGYELYVEGPASKNGTDTVSQVIKVPDIKYTISSINNSKLINFKEYKIKVRSVNGDWRSPWSKEVPGIPAPQKKPEPPDYVTATGGYNCLNVSWKDMDDSSAYMVYYKKKIEPDDKYRPVIKDFELTPNGTNAITQNTYTIDSKIEQLDDNTEYSVYVIGWNELGWGSKSLVSIGKTKSSKPPILPEYMLINTSSGSGVKSAHIEDATIGGHGGAKMVGSPLDEAKANKGFGLVDNNYDSYWSKEDWDDGVGYPGSDRGMYITLDKAYEMSYITFAAQQEGVPLESVKIEYLNTNNKYDSVGARLIRKNDENDNPFYIIKFDEKVTTKKVHISLGRSYTRAEMKVGEIRFHEHDKIEDEIMGLYVDEMHTTLREDVTLKTIEDLGKRLETKNNNELHPLYSELKLEIKTATEILNNKNLSTAYNVINDITGQKDGHLGFGGLNSWQPLGKSVYAGEALVVYVGHNTKRTGDSTNLSLVMTQYHSEVVNLSSARPLKIGRNEITVPQIATKDFERGGQLYVSYSGNSSSDKYAVRVLGGSNIPVLNLHGLCEKLNDASEENERVAKRKEVIAKYIQELEAYNDEHIKAKHNSEHKDSKYSSVNYNYDETNCILNATDIMMDKMMYSLPATQVLRQLSNKSDKTTWLDTSLNAMEDAMTLFYHHKGLSNKTGAGDKNRLPAQHLNIRYMRMFAGAFMYAAGNHIGIEYGSSGVASGPQKIADFGWGIGHEIGHDINQGTYAVAEVTNNYFSQLMTGTERYNWENVYKKVTSGATGRASNVFTQLAMYWQLHLAFDEQEDDQHVYDNYSDQFNKIFFARVDTYSRNPDAAPAPKKIKLTLTGDSDQKIMRLACAAAEKNILSFFERWGMVPDADTIKYAGQFTKEEKALYYVCPAARKYRLDNTENGTEVGTILNQDAIENVEATAKQDSNQVDIKISAKNNTTLESILGYEITRSMINDGKEISQLVGFQPVGKISDKYTASSNIVTTFTDTVSTINNRVMTYTVKAVDRYLNYSNPVTAEPVKVETNGILDKSSWTVETDMSSKDDTEIIPANPSPDPNVSYDNESMKDPDSGYDENYPNKVASKKNHTIDYVIDKADKNDNTYKGTIANGKGTITIDMHKEQEVTALKYSGDSLGNNLSNLTIEVSTDNISWTPVNKYNNVKKETDSYTVWFDSVKPDERANWIGTYDARYVRLTITQTGNIRIKEIDLCGPSGDNVTLTEEDGIPAIGILNENFKYGNQAADVIPSGSAIFTGTYKGNPAYNVVVLYDSVGNVVGGEKDGVLQAGQVIFAQDPKDGNLGETSDGRWVYYIEPTQLKSGILKDITKVRAELYRVDDAKTLEGERITSDTEFVTVPGTLPSITLTGNTLPPASTSPGNQ